jgi:O-antigen/teichoic acid export membrane protein
MVSWAQDVDVSTARSARGRSARQIAWTAAANLTLPITALVSGPILARTLGPVGRGELAAVLMPVTFAVGIALLGIPSAVTFYVARRHAPSGRIIRQAAPVVLGGSAVAAIVLIALAPYLLGSYPEGVRLLQAAALVIPGAAFIQLLRGAVLGRRRYGFANAEQSLTAVLRAGGLVLLALAGALTVSTALWMTILAGLPAAALLLLGLRTAAADHPDASASATEIVGYGARAWGGTVADAANRRLDQVLMLPLAGALQLGYYAVAVALAEFANILVGAIQRVLFSESAARRDWGLVERAGRCTVLVIGVGAGVGFLAAPFLVELLFGGDFAPASSMARVLFVAAVPASVGSVLAAGLLGAGHPGGTSIAQGVALCLTLAGIAVLVPRFGGLGAAYTSLVAYSGFLSVILWKIKRSALGPLMACLVPTVGDAAWLLRQFDWPRSRRAAPGPLGDASR